MGASKSSLRSGEKPKSGGPPPSGEDVDALARELASLQATGTNVDYDLLQMDLRMQQQLAEIDGCELEDEDVAEEDAEGEDELLGIDEDELRELEAEMEELERSIMPEERSSPATPAAGNSLASKYLAASIASPTASSESKQTSASILPENSRPRESSPQDTPCTTHGKPSVILSDETIDLVTEGVQALVTSLVEGTSPAVELHTMHPPHGPHVGDLLADLTCHNADSALVADGAGAELLEPEAYTFPVAC